MLALLFILAAPADAGLARATIFTIGFGPQHSLEGSSGQAWAIDGSLRKVALTLYGETYRKELEIDVTSGEAGSVTEHIHRYRGGLADPVIIHTQVVRFELRGEAVVQKDPKAPVPPESAQLARDVLAALRPCIREPQRPGCDEILDSMFDLQAPDDHPRIAEIKREFARTQKELASYERRTFTMPNWELEGVAHRDGKGHLRKLELVFAGKPRHELYFKGTDLLFSLSGGDTRVYYTADRGVLRIITPGNKRVVVSTMSRADYAVPILEFSDFLGPCFDGNEPPSSSCPR